MRWSLVLPYLRLQSGHSGRLGVALRLLGFALRLLLPDDRDQFRRAEWSQFPLGHIPKCTIKPDFFQPLGEGFFRLKTKVNSYRKRRKAPAGRDAPGGAEVKIHRRDAEDAEKDDMKELTEKIIGAAIEVHRTLGPGLLESAYEECLAHEMRLRKLSFERQAPLPVAYKGVKLDCGYRLDFLVEKAVVLELKAVDTLQPIHEAQVLTYLKLGGWTVGLLINFNVPVLKNGIKRVVLNYKDVSASSAPLR